MVMDIGTRAERSQTLAIRLEQVRAAGGAVFGTTAELGEGAVFGKQIDEALDVSAPYTVTVAQGQFADCFAVGEFGDSLLEAFGHRKYSWWCLGGDNSGTGWGPCLPVFNYGSSLAHPAGI